jgi:7-carboxy-7-deazaguanine synthase
VAALWLGDGPPYVVCTGGEPLLQLDAALVSAFHQEGLEVAVETNGTIPVPDGIDWVCVSPKANTKLVVTEGDELKLVYPQIAAEPQQFEHLNFTHFYLQPMDGPRVKENQESAIRYCQSHDQWRLSMQMHKILGIR